jgi:hypothetical protein
MSLTNKVAQFDADSDLVNAWVHGPASGAGSTITTDSGTVRTPAKLIADIESAVVNASENLVLFVGSSGAGLVGTIPAGTLTASNVQAAINELDNEKASLVGLAAPTGASLVGFTSVGSGAVARTAAAKLQENLTVADYGALSDGTTDDYAAVVAANTAAGSKPLMFTGVTHIGTTITITAPIFDTMAQIFSTTSLVTIDNGQPVRPEWFGMGNGNINLAVQALPASGGIVQLEDKTYPPQGYVYGTSGAFKYLSKANVSIVGRKMPSLALDCKSLVGGTIIQDMFLVYADNFEMRDVGIDSGKTFVDSVYAGAAREGLLLTYPSEAIKASSALKRRARLHNVIGLCSAPTALVHACIVGEGYAGVTCTGEVVGCYGTHGIIIKCTDVTANKFTAYCNGGEGVIIKSDSQTTAISSNIQIGKISTYASGPDGWTPYAVATTGWGTLIDAPANNVSVLQIGAIYDRGHATGFGLSIAPGKTVDNLQIGMITTDGNSSCCVDLTAANGAQLARSSISQIVARNTPVGLYTNLNATNPAVLGTLTVVNAAVAYLDVGNVSAAIGIVVAENCTSGAVRLLANARPEIGSIIKLGSTTNTYATDSGGVAPTLLNGATNVAGNELFGVTHIGYGINLQGLVMPGTSNVLGQLPFFARPVKPKRFMAQGFNGAAVFAVPVVIGADGAVVVNEVAGGIANCTSWISLAGINYSLEN